MFSQPAAESVRKSLQPLINDCCCADVSITSQILNARMASRTRHLGMPPEQKATVLQHDTRQPALSTAEHLVVTGAGGVTGTFNHHIAKRPAIEAEEFFCCLCRHRGRETGRKPPLLQHLDQGRMNCRVKIFRPATPGMARWHSESIREIRPMHQRAAPARSSHHRPTSHLRDITNGRTLLETTE